MVLSAAMSTSGTSSWERVFARLAFRGFGTEVPTRQDLPP
jgi:hypothetical protein